MRGKEKCKILKQIRKQIADENDIPYVVEECKHKGECRGTCPKCEAELRQLERELSLRHRIGKTVAIAGLAAGMLTMTTGCTLEDVADTLSDMLGIDHQQQVMGELEPPLSGDVYLPPETGVLPYEPTMGEPTLREDGDYGQDETETGDDKVQPSPARMEVH